MLYLTACGRAAGDPILHLASLFMMSLLRICTALVAAVAWNMAIAYSEEPKGTSAQTPPAHLAQPSTPRELALLRQFYDETVWKDERLAQEYEKTIVRIWDQFLHHPDNWEVLLRLPVQQIRLGPLSKYKQFDHGIEHWKQTADPASAKVLTAQQWKSLATSIQSKGYRIVETEWHHSEFLPPTAEQPAARSVVAMVIHADHPKQQQRFVLRGNLRITWTEKRMGNTGLFLPQKVDATDVFILQRQGPLAFDDQKIARFSLRPDQRSNATHPILVEDLNGDHLPEVIVAGGNVVFWNQGNFQFEERPFLAFPPKEINAGVLGDFDGDGLCDFFCGVKLGFPKLFLGDGQGNFQRPGRDLRFTSDPLNVPVSVTTGDIDGDGDLDVFIGQNKTGYQTGEIPSPYYDANDSYPSYLLVNRGDGTFSDQTAVSGLGQKRNRRNFGSSFVDLDADGDLDLLLTNDFCGNDLFLNDGNGVFQDVTETLSPKSMAHGMSHTLGDFNLDGTLDFFTIGMSSTTARRLDKLQLGRPDLPEHNRQRKHMGYGNRMYLRNGTDFQQAPFNNTVARTGWSWGSTTFDFDNDGDPDVYIANGQTSGKTTQDYCTRYWCHDLYQSTRAELAPVMKQFFQEMAPMLNGEQISWNGYEHNSLLMNLDGKEFLNVAYLLGCASVLDSRSVVSADLNNDGLVDLLFEHIDVTNGDTSLHFLKNQGAAAGNRNWIGVHLVSSSTSGDSSDTNLPSTWGAQVEVLTAKGTLLQHRVAGTSVWAQHPSSFHFGLNDATEAESLHVRWPNGAVSEIESPAINRYHVIRPTATP